MHVVLKIGNLAFDAMPPLLDDFQLLLVFGQTTFRIGYLLFLVGTINDVAPKTTFQFSPSMKILQVIKKLNNAIIFA